MFSFKFILAERWFGWLDELTCSLKLCLCKEKHQPDWLSLSHMAPVVDLPCKMCPWNGQKGCCSSSNTIHTYIRTYTHSCTQNKHIHTCTYTYTIMCNVSLLGAPFSHLVEHVVTCPHHLKHVHLCQQPLSNIIVVRSVNHLHQVYC